MLDYYQILGATPDTDAASLRTAYRRRAKLLHPDRHVGQTADVVAEATRAMSELTEAFEVLSDTRKRSQYDRMRSSGSGTSSNHQAADEKPRTVVDRTVEVLLSTMHEILADADQSFDSATGDLARFIVGVAATQLETAYDIVRHVTMEDDSLPLAVAYVAVGMAVDISCSDADMPATTPPMLGAFGALLRARLGARLDEKVLMHLPRMSTPSAAGTANRTATWPSPGASGKSSAQSPAQEEPGRPWSSTADATGRAHNNTAPLAVIAIMILIAILAAAAEATDNADPQPTPSASSAATSTSSPTLPSADPWVARHDCLVQSPSGGAWWQPVSCSRKHDAVIESVHRSASATRCPDSSIAFDDDWGAYCAALR
jgi:hypothetical protein